MINLVYWLAPLTIGISNMIISELMHLAPFQGTHGRTAGMRGWKLMHPVSSGERIHSWNNFWSFVDICKSWMSSTFPVFLFPFILRSWKKRVLFHFLKKMLLLFLPRWIAVLPSARMQLVMGYCFYHCLCPADENYSNWSLVLIN